MDMKKAKSRNENIFDTLSNSDWFIEQCNQAREKYLKSGKDEIYLKKEVKRLSQYLPAYWESIIRELLRLVIFNCLRFKSSRAELKRDLLRFVVSNLILKDKKLDFSLKVPFNIVALHSKNENWQALSDYVGTYYASL